MVGDIFIVVEVIAILVVLCVLDCTLVGVISAVIIILGSTAERKSVVGIISLDKNMLNIEGEIL